MNEKVTVYVALQHEGTEVWRPVEAERQEDGLYLLLGDQDETETWEFPPGAVVRCQERNFAGGRHGLAAYERVH